jgi:uncharacterized membrane protein required for colicin V production
MIPVEYLWLVLVFCFGIIGAARGLAKELGSSTVLLLSIFVLMAGWERIGSKLVEGLPGTMPAETVQAIFYITVLCFVTFISYEGIVLQFPVRKQSGLLKWILGFWGGLFNGYLIIGTIWAVIDKAKYFQIEVPMGSTGASAPIAATLTELNASMVQFLPINFINEFVFLLLGLILLLAIILK